MSILNIILAILAVYRIAHLVAYEEGPFSLILKLRTFVARRWPYSWIDNGLGCPLCISFWLSLGAPFLPQLALYILGIAGAAMLIHLVLVKE